jgi:hypothetical protein
MRASPFLRSLPLAACLLGTLVGAPAARAKVTSESPYSKAQTYNGAFRFIRVDQGLEVFEQDRETGYLLFRYKSDNETSTGSVEVVEVDGAVKLIIQLPRLPEYHEQVLTDGLLRKLREEYGEPPRREPKKPKDDLVRRPEDREPDADAPARGKTKKTPRRDDDKS